MGVAFRRTIEKADRFWFAPWGGENPSQMRPGCKSCTAISRRSRGVCEWHSNGRLKKRTGFGSHPGERKSKPDAAGTQFAHSDFSPESRGMRAAFRRAIEKADRFWFAPWGAEERRQRQAGRSSCTAISRRRRGGCERHSAGRLRKRRGYCEKAG